jgi:hypothetical protein
MATIKWEEDGYVFEFPKVFPCIKCGKAFTPKEIILPTDDDGPSCKIVLRDRDETERFSF